MAATGTVHAALRQAASSGQRAPLRKDFIPDLHPRWPAKAPDSQGGQFAPKGSAGPADENHAETGSLDYELSSGPFSSNPRNALASSGDDAALMSADFIPARGIPPSLPRHMRPPEVELTWLDATHAPSHDPGASPQDIRDGVQARFASKTGQLYYIDPKDLQLESAVDIGNQIQQSINSGGYMSGVLNRAIQTGQPVTFSTDDWHPKPGTGRIRFQNSYFTMDNIGRVAGEITDGSLSVAGDQSYTASGTISLTHTGTYDWTPDGEDSLKDMAIRAGGSRPFFYNGHWQSYSEGKPMPLEFTRKLHFKVHGYYPPYL